MSTASAVSTVYTAVLPPSLMVFLAVQDSSIGDLVNHSLTHSVINSSFDFSVFRALLSCHYNDYNDYNDCNDYNDYNDYND